ncbi:MAG: isocitrate/isopropylmalate family dehydrogenase [Halobacteria archaeon]
MGLDTSGDGSGDGERVSYDGRFIPPEKPVVPTFDGVGRGRTVIPAARRVLTAAANSVGRKIRWLHLPAGDGAVEEHDSALPDETVEKMKRYRVSFTGPLDTHRYSPGTTASRIIQELDLYASVHQAVRLDWMPCPINNPGDTEILMFRDLKLEKEAEEAVGEREKHRRSVHRLIEVAVEYGFERDRNHVTVVDDVTTETEFFIREAMDYIDSEYGDTVITERERRKLHGDGYPEDKLVVEAVDGADLCRTLVSCPGEVDVVAASYPSGRYVSSVMAEVTGGVGNAPECMVGDGYFVAGTGEKGIPREFDVKKANPVGAILSGRLLFEQIGWYDASRVVEKALKETFRKGIFTPEIAARSERSRKVDTEEFTDAVVEEIETGYEEEDETYVESSFEERRDIKETIAAVHNTVFQDDLDVEGIHLNQLGGVDEEAEIFLPEVGINFRYWREWSVERKVEVILHELAHVENYYDDHQPSFYERFVELTDIAEDWSDELEEKMGEDIKFGMVKRLIVESVHEDTVEPDIESPSERRRLLKEEFGLA